VDSPENSRIRFFVEFVCAFFFDFRLQ